MKETTKMSKETEKKTYRSPSLKTMGKMNRMTKGTKGGSELDADGQTPDFRT